MGISEINTCRVCHGEVFEPILDFGDMHFTGRFQYKNKPKVPSGPLNVVKCNTCHLVQLKHNYNLDDLYRHDYGYRSGINRTMREHLSSITDQVAKVAKLKPGDCVLDIGSNDATLLKSYNVDKLVKVGMDPTAQQFATHYPPEITAIPEYFDADRLIQEIGKNPIAAITSIAVIYDLPDPNKFFSDIRKIISKDGVWVFEQSYMPRMLEQSAFDSICHEHIEYYTLTAVDKLLRKNGLRVFDVSFNDMNGGSFRVFSCSDEASFQRQPAVDTSLKEESELGLESLKPYKEFANRASEASIRLIKFLQKEKTAGKSILGYGASTKGNTLLQYCGIDGSLISAIADRNPSKWGARTPKTDIPIISEEHARALNPDYFLVLPWHFRDEFIRREEKFLATGGSFIFALPKLTIVNRYDEIKIAE